MHRATASETDAQRICNRAPDCYGTRQALIKHNIHGMIGGWSRGRGMGGRGAASAQIYGTVCELNFRAGFSELDFRVLTVDLRVFLLYYEGNHYGKVIHSVAFAESVQHCNHFHYRVLLIAI